MRTPGEIAEVLCELYVQDFRDGRTTGRYKIKRSDLRAIADRRQLQNSIIGQVTDELFERGYLLSEISDDFFVVIKETFFANTRMPSQALLSTFCSNIVIDDPNNDPIDEDE